MFLTIDHFASVWKSETAGTFKLLNVLTDESLAKPDHADIRSLGRVAWHIVTTFPEMCGRMGITVDIPSEKDPIPKTAAEIKKYYKTAAETVLKAVSEWKDADLKTTDDMYGETWERGRSLWVFLVHEIHHRGQMTVLMRMAGLDVPGIYGPSRDEWSKYGMETPAL